MRRKLVLMGLTCLLAVPAFAGGFALDRGFAEGDLLTILEGAAIVSLTLVTIFILVVPLRWRR